MIGFIGMDRLNGAALARFRALRLTARNSRAELDILYFAAARNGS